jgi:hypothetical protein
MTSKFRRLPPVCLVLSLARLISGRLRLSGQFKGETIEMDDHSSFRVFRHIRRKEVNYNSDYTVFIVSFKFSHLSHKANKLASVMPMLLITGFPGFVKKVYAVNPENGYWQGMYQWRSAECLEEYKHSLVFRLMNKRAIPETIKSVQYENRSLDDLIMDLRIQEAQGSIQTA